MDVSRTTAYFRGQYLPFDEAQLSIASAPVLYGLSVYTVIPVFWNVSAKRHNAFRVRDHFRRLQNSARIMAFDDFLADWDYERFEHLVQQLVQRNKLQHDCLVRITVYVDDILKGTQMKGLRHDLAAFVYPMAPLLPAKGASLGVSSWIRTPDNAIPSRAKINGSYANSALMKHEALQNGYDDAISLDAHGHVAESTVSNIFLVRGGSLLTSADSTDILEGITRDTIFCLAARLDIPVLQRAIDRSELYLADEIFLCGSSVGIVPVIMVDQRPVGSGRPGALTKKLGAEYDRRCRHQVPDDQAWLTPITA